MDPAIVVAGISGAVAAGSMVMTYRSSSRATRVNESAEQRQWAAEAREDARATRREMAEVRREAEALAAKLHTLVMAIHDPAITLPRLRAMVPVGSGLNGTYPADGL